MTVRYSQKFKKWLQLKTYAKSCTGIKRPFTDSVTLVEGRGRGWLIRFLRKLNAKAEAEITNRRFMSCHLIYLLAANWQQPPFGLPQYPRE